MVLVALLFLPCMVIVTTVAIPLLLLVIAVIAIPILLYCDCSNIMHIFPMTNSSSYLTEEFGAAVPLQSNRNSAPLPPALGVSSRSACRRMGTTTNTALKRSSSSFNKKKVTFQECNDNLPRSNDYAHHQHHHQQAPPGALHMQSSIEWPTASLLRHRRRQSPYHFHSREATLRMDTVYQNALHQPRPEHIYHQPVCVS
jgi:hypothetical protein